MDNFSGRIIEIPPQNLMVGHSRVSIGLKPPEGYKLNAQAPFYVNFKSSDDKVLRITTTPDNVRLDPEKHTFEIPIEGNFGSAEITLETVAYFCPENSSACYFDNVRAVIPISIVEKGAGMFGITLNLSILPRL